MSQHRLANKTAIITGAARGVGRGIALAFAKEGANVAVVDLLAEQAEQTAAELRALGAQAVALTGDVAQRATADRIVADVVARWGSVDILVNNAQNTNIKPFEQVTDADIHLAYSTGTLATVYFTQAVFPHFRAKNHGKVINFASGAGIDGQFGQAAYTMAKEAIRGLSRVLATEWGQYGINVNVICPFANSPGMLKWAEDYKQVYDAAMATLPMRRLGDCENDIGRTAVFLASHDSDYITGQTIMVDGGGVMVR